MFPLKMLTARNDLEKTRISNDWAKISSVHRCSALSFFFFSCNALILLSGLNYQDQK